MKIDTIIFDMGGTIDETQYSLEDKDGIATRVFEILDMSCDDTKAAYEKIWEGFSEYKLWREESLVEAHPGIVWDKWILRDFDIPKEKIYERCEDLAYYWETEVILRTCKEEAKETLEKLQAMGLKLGIISNTGSFTQVGRSLKAYGLDKFFKEDEISLSVGYGIRKPHGYIFYDTLAKMGSQAEKSIYVGDTISRDVIGSKAAGFAKAIQIVSEFTKGSDSHLEGDLPKPDYTIENLLEIVRIVEEINK